MHRELEPNPTALELVLSSAWVLATVIAPIVVLSFGGDVPNWQWLLLGWAALGWLAIGAIWWRAVRNPENRRWFAVAEGGLLTWRPASGDPPRPIPWEALEADALEVPHVSHVGDLERALGQKGPVGTWTWPRIGRLVGWCVIGAITAPVLWYAAVPVALDVTLGEEPDDLTELSRICGGGNPFGRAPAYAGTGPHPIAVYDEVDAYPVFDQGLRPDPANRRRRLPDTVELVGCVRPAGRASQEPVERCIYVPRGRGPGEHTDTWYRGRYRLDVYEARTGRKVDSLTVDGSPEHECEETSTAGEMDAVTSQAHETDPRGRDFATVLSPLVNRPLA